MGFYGNKMIPGKLDSLAAHVEKLGIQSVSKLPEFALKGQVPAKIAQVAKYEFVPKDPAVKKALSAFQKKGGLKQLGVHWAFKHEKDNLIPFAICFTTRNQVIVPADGQHNFV